MAQQRKKKRRRERSEKKRGVMIGMRSGFKKAARGVGVGEEKPAARKKSSWLNTAVTIALILAAIAILFYRNR
jgi:Mg2+/citrate symporter